MIDFDLKNKTFRSLAFNILLALIGIVLLFFPKDFFDNGQSICLSVLFFDTECFGCGMTRAVMHLLHFDFEQAWQYNKLSVLVLPLIVIIIIRNIIRDYKILTTNDSTH